MSNVNILQVRNVRSSTARTTNRFTLRFNGLEAVLDRAKNSPLPAIRNRYNNLLPAMTRTGWRLSDGLELSLASVSVPPMETEVVDVWRFHDSSKHVTRFAQMGDMTATFYDYVSGSASAIMLTWAGLVGERQTGAIGFKEDYILPEAELYEFGPQAPAETNPTAYGIHQIVNLYPRTVELGEFSYETAEVRKVTVQFAVEAVYPKRMRGI